jgi:DNA polymerase-4/DNA polymerase V
MHIDGDAFFASVEIAKNPSLRGKPVVVGKERGIASAFSYEAKALGITRGLPIYQIHKRFPQVVILPGDYISYTTYSEKMFDIVRRYTDNLEEYSIDECFADLTGWDKPLKMSYEKILLRIQNEIKEELDISVSIGLASTKVLAKVASKWRKPGGITLIPDNLVYEFLIKTPIEKIWGIGRRTSVYLNKKGIITAYDLAIKDEAWVTHILSKPYIEIWKELNCILVSKVDPRKKDTYASIQKTRTFYPPTSNPEMLMSQISKNLEGACSKARHYSLRASRVAIFLKTQEFRYYSCEISLLAPSNIPEIILPIVRKEFPKVFRSDRVYRTTGVTLRDLVSGEMRQESLFGEDKKDKKFEIIHKEVDALVEKFGVGVVHLASTNKAFRKQTRGATDTDDLDRNLLFL